MIDECQFRHPGLLPIPCASVITGLYVSYLLMGIVGGWSTVQVTFASMHGVVLEMDPDHTPVEEEDQIHSLEKEHERVQVS